MAPEHGAPKSKHIITRARPDPHFSDERCETETLSLGLGNMQSHVLDIVAVGTLSNAAPGTVLAARRHRNSSRFMTVSHARTAPQFPQASVDKRTRRQTLTNQYDVHKRNIRIDQFSRQAVSGTNISRFMQPSSPTSPTSHPRSLPEDLNYSLRRFIVADPAQDANVVYARIAIEEGHTTVGHVPALLWPRCTAKHKEYFASGTEGDDLEGQYGQQVL